MNQQESLWRGEFGDAYHARNVGFTRPKVADILFMGRFLRHTVGIKSVVEFGAGNGRNLVPFQSFLDNDSIWAVEINESAASQIPVGHALRGSILDTKPYMHCDLAMTRGLLIHIAPENLPAAYDTLFLCSRRYILMAEYYSPSPRSIPYHGRDDALWTRDFAGDMLERFHNLAVIDYGFNYRHDQFSQQDDTTWWMLEKR